MPFHLVILEDDERRREAMAERWGERHPGHPIVCFATAAEAIRHLTLHLDDVLALSLDHDLEMIEGANGVRFDPGSGREVADFLAPRSPKCPVVVHSTNAAAAVGMCEELRDGGWIVDRVVPYGDLAWIDEVWFPALRAAIRRVAIGRTAAAVRES
jgi:hypothetical protein